MASPSNTKSRDKPNNKINLTRCNNSTRTAVLPQREKRQSKVYQAGQCWQCGVFGHFKRNCPLLKGKGLLQEVYV